MRVVGQKMDHYPQKGPEMMVVGKKKDHYPHQATIASDTTFRQTQSDILAASA